MTAQRASQVHTSSGKLKAVLKHTLSIVFNCGDYSNQKRFFLHYTCVLSGLIARLLSDFKIDSVHNIPKEIGQLIHRNAWIPKQ